MDDLKNMTMELDKIMAGKKLQEGDGTDRLVSDILQSYAEHPESTRLNVSSILNRELLLDGQLQLWDPQAFYSKASARMGEESITVLYSATALQRQTEKTTIVNCGPARKLYLDGFAGKAYRIVDCMGKETAQGVLAELSALTVPCAGMILI